MIITFDYKEGFGEIYILDDSPIDFSISSEGILSKELSWLRAKLLRAGRFNHGGIPGKKLTSDPKEEIIQFLNSREDVYEIKNINTIETNEDYLGKDIRDFNEVLLNKLIKGKGELREFKDRYEYCFFNKYEKRCRRCYIDSIPLGDIFVQIASCKGSRSIVAIDFSKGKFTKREIVNWLTRNNVTYINNDNMDYVTDCNSIEAAVKFYGKPVILYKKGKETIYFNRKDITEITDAYIKNEQKVDTTELKEVFSLHQNSKIIYNGQEIDYVPEIKFDIPNGDIIISNGHVIVADYIGDYCGCVGFYSNNDNCIPVAWLQDNITTVYLEIYEGDNYKLGVVEAKYFTDIESILLNWTI